MEQGNISYNYIEIFFIPFRLKKKTINGLNKVIIGRILILFGICSFILTLISNYFDIVLQIDGKNEITQLGQFWFHFAPNSLQIAETIVSRYVDPCSALDILDCSGFIWHPFISSILLMPAAPMLALLSFIFISLGLKKSVRRREKSKI